MSSGAAVHGYAQRRKKHPRRDNAGVPLQRKKRKVKGASNANNQPRGLATVPLDVKFNDGGDQNTEVNRGMQWRSPTTPVSQTLMSLSTGNLTSSALLDKGPRLPINTESTLAVPQMTKKEVQEAFKALKSKLTRQKGNKRQNGRRLKSEPFKLSDSQLIQLAAKYKVARSENRDVDYKRTAKSIHFVTFKGNADELEKKEPWVVNMLWSALKEQRKIDAGNSKQTDTQDDWNEKTVTTNQQQLGAQVAGITTPTELNAEGYVSSGSHKRRDEHGFGGLPIEVPGATENQRAAIDFFAEQLDRRVETQHRRLLQLSLWTEQLEEESRQICRHNESLEMLSKLNGGEQVAHDRERWQIRQHRDVMCARNNVILSQVNCCVRALQNQIDCSGDCDRRDQCDTMSCSFQPGHKKHEMPGAVLRQPRSVFAPLSPTLGECSTISNQKSYHTSLHALDAGEGS